MKTITQQNSQNKNSRLILKSLFTFIIVLVCTLGFTKTSYATFTFVQGNTDDNLTGNTVALTGITAGHLIVLCAKWETVSGSITATDGTTALTMGTASPTTVSTMGQCGYLLSANSGNKTFTVTYPGGSNGRRIRIAEFSYTGTVVFDTDTANQGTGTAVSSGNINTSSLDELVFGFYGENNGAVDSNQKIDNLSPDGFVGTAGGAIALMMYKTFSSTFTGSSTLTLSASQQWSMNIIAFKNSALSVDQNAFRFRNDDGTQTTATWMANENTSIAKPLGTAVRLRALLNATGDPPTVQYQLEYKKRDDVNYRKVLTAQPTISIVGTSTQVVTNTGGATLSPSIPAGLAAGDLMLMIIAGRPNGSAITNSVDRNWSPIQALPTFREVTTLANDLDIDIWYKVATTSAEVAPVVTPDSDFLPGSTTGGVSAQIIAFRNVDTDNPINKIATSSSVAAATWTPPSVTTTINNEMVVSAVETADDNALNFNTANSFQLNMGLASYNTTTGSDHAIGVGTVTKASFGAVTMPIWNESANSTDAWVGITLSLRPRIDNILMNASGNITASGENTTAQLTAPSGKATSDFVTGRMQDDENPADTIDITSDDYSEFEWSITTAGNAAAGDVYRFRVTTAGTALGSYSVTPEWTIGDTIAGIRSIKTALRGGYIRIRGGRLKLY